MKKQTTAQIAKQFKLTEEELINNLEFIIFKANEIIKNHKAYDDMLEKAPYTGNIIAREKYMADRNFIGREVDDFLYRSGFYTDYTQYLIDYFNDLLRDELYKDIVIN